MLEGPTAIAFLESDGDPVAVAKALVDAARETRVRVVRGGLLEGRPIEADEIESLAKLPPLDVLRSQVLAAVIGPVTGIVALFTAPLQDLYGLIDARIEQLEAQGDTSGAEVSGSEPQSAQAVEEPAAEVEPEAGGEASGSEPQSAQGAEEPAAEAEPEAGGEASGSEPQAESAETETDTDTDTDTDTEQEEH